MNAMMDFLIEGPADARLTIHAYAWCRRPDGLELVAIGFRVARFEFDYMASRRISGSRKPPPKAEKLIPEYRSAIESLDVHAPLIIGGKSMGGRVASMIADEFHASDKIAGLGHPFHPPSEPKSLRPQHLETIQTPALIGQGTREEFGNHAEVADFALSARIEIVWLDDSDHDLKPRQTVAGFTASDHLPRCHPRLSPGP